MIVFEALRAQHGDALMLHFGTKAKPKLAVIDAGPTGVYNDAVKPRLLQIRKQRKLADGKPLEIDLMMVSHIDDDHVVGIVDHMRAMKDLRDGGAFVPWRILKFWHNSFDDIIGNDAADLAGPASTASLASVQNLIPGGDGSAILASVANGRELRQLIEAFGLEGNSPFADLVIAGRKAVKLGNLSITVVAPDQKRLQKLQTKWDKEIKPILKKKAKTKGDVAALADYSDRSVHNLSSIVMLVEADKKRMLLTGDGRGDHTLAGLKAAKLLDKKGRLEIDLLKVPHHGSIRNVEQNYFDTIRAEHYVISANGRDDNPDIATLKLISKSRKDDDFTIHLTYPADEYRVPAIGKKVDAFFKAEKKAKRKYRVNIRKPGDLSLSIPL